MWFETKCTYDKVQESGAVEKITEPYLVDAQTFTEAETRITEKLMPFIRGEFAVKTAKRTKIAEVFNADFDKFYLAKVGFVAIDENTGVERITPSQMIIGANNFKDAINVLEEAMEGTMADYEILSISETGIVEVVPAEKKEEAI